MCFNVQAVSTQQNIGSAVKTFFLQIFKTAEMNCWTAESGKGTPAATKDVAS